jgi:A/G-specific adenine glycosylase
MDDLLILESWYNKNKRSLPWRNTSDPYKIWVSEVMLQQTRIQTVLQYYDKFISIYPTLEDLASAPLDDVMKAWQGLGYYSRCKNMVLCSNIIVKDYNGIFPTDYKTLCSLPGFGNYTASIISSIVNKENKVSVDGNVFRVFARYNCSMLDYSKESSKKSCQNILENLHKVDPGIFNSALMELGETICTPQNPNCYICPIQSTCLAFKNKAQLQYPIKTVVIKRKIEDKFLLWLVIKDKFILKRINYGLLKETYSPITLSSLDYSEELYKRDAQIIQKIHLSNYKYLFSHIEWRVKQIVVFANSISPLTDDYLVSKDDLIEKYAIASAFKKGLKEVLDLII